MATILLSSPRINSTQAHLRYIQKRSFRSQIFDSFLQVKITCLFHCENSATLCISLSLFETPKHIEAPWQRWLRGGDIILILLPCQDAGQARARPRIYGQFFLLIFISSTRERACTQRRRLPFLSLPSLLQVLGPSHTESVARVARVTVRSERAAFSNVLTSNHRRPYPTADGYIESWRRTSTTSRREHTFPIEPGKLVGVVERRRREETIPSPSAVGAAREVY